MGLPDTVAARCEHAFSLAPRLRDADRDELLAHGRQPLTGLLRCVHLSAQAHAIVAPEGHTLALYGFGHLGGGVAAPWLLGSEELITTYRGWFIRQSAQIVSSGDHRWNHFKNHVDARNRTHIRWLRWAGFTVHPPEPHGPHGLPFHPIERTI